MSVAWSLDRLRSCCNCTTSLCSRDLLFNTTGGHSEEIMYQEVVLVIQLKEICGWVHYPRYSEYLYQERSGYTEWGKSILTSRFLGKASLLCTEWKEVSYYTMSKISCIHVALCLYFLPLQGNGCELQWLLWVSLRVWYGTVPVQKLEGMKFLIFNSLSPIWRKKLFPKIQISMCREFISTWSYISFSGEEIPTQTKKRQRHQGISHVDPLAPGTTWEAHGVQWALLLLYSAQVSAIEQPGVLLQPSDSQYWNINSQLETWERTLSRDFNRREPPSPVWTLLNGITNGQKDLETISFLSHASQASWI